MICIRHSSEGFRNTTRHFAAARLILGSIFFTITFRTIRFPGKAPVTVSGANHSGNPSPVRLPDSLDIRILLLYDVTSILFAGTSFLSQTERITK